MSLRSTVFSISLVDSRSVSEVVVQLRSLFQIRLQYNVERYVKQHILIPAKGGDAFFAAE